MVEFLEMGLRKRTLDKHHRYRDLWYDFVDESHCCYDLLDGLDLNHRLKVVLIFIGYLQHRKHLGHIAIKDALSSLRHLLQTHGCDAEFLHNPTIKTARDALIPSGRLLNLLAPIRRPRLPVTFDLIGYMGTTIGSSIDLNDTMTYVGIVIAFHFMLRVSEYCYDPDNKHALMCPDVMFVLDDGTRCHPWQLNKRIIGRTVSSISFIVRSSKADTTGVGRHLYIDRSSSPESFLINLLTYWVHVAGHTDALDPFLSRYRMSHGRWYRKKLTRHMISQALKTAASYFNLDEIYFSSHSLRIGGATAASLAGVDDATIKRTGGWSKNSTAYLRYIHSTPQDHGTFALLGQNLPTLTTTQLRVMGDSLRPLS